MIRIATRKSPLALWQANYIRDRLIQSHPNLTVTLVPMTTKGDKILDTPLAKIGGKGLFVKELEQGLLSKEADIAVHSMKDVPAELPDGLDLPIICQRASPLDAFVSNHYRHLSELPKGARVGTSSLRRRCQVLAHRPDLKVFDLRGGVGTRLAKLDRGDFDAIILAVAGLERLEISHRICDSLSPEILLPAVGQGAIGIECRAEDQAVLTSIAPLNHPETQRCVTAERAMNHRLEGGCQAPIAAYAEQHGATLHLRGLVGRPDGNPILREKQWGSLHTPEQLGIELAETLLNNGADTILREIYRS